MIQLKSTRWEIKSVNGSTQSNNVGGILEFNNENIFTNDENIFIPSWGFWSQNGDTIKICSRFNYKVNHDLTISATSSELNSMTLETPIGSIDLDLI